jgi:hypothetical protein
VCHGLYYERKEGGNVFYDVVFLSALRPHRRSGLWRITRRCLSPGDELYCWGCEEIPPIVSEEGFVFEEWKEWEWKE